LLLKKCQVWASISFSCCQELCGEELEEVKEMFWSSILLARNSPIM